MKTLQKYFFTGALILVANVTFGQSGDTLQVYNDTLHMHKNSYGVWIDHCLFTGSFSESDSVVIKLGTTEGSNNIKEYKDVLNFSHQTSDMEGTPNLTTGNYVFRALLEAKDEVNATKFVTIMLRRNGVILKQQSYSLLQ